MEREKAREREGGTIKVNFNRIRASNEFLIKTIRFFLFR